MSRNLYSVLFYLAMPIVLLRLAYRASKSSAYARRVNERLGYFKKPGFVERANFDGAIWLHSVSVGETIAASPIIKRLQQEHPFTPLVITTMTPTGSERVKALFGDSVFHVYAPYDLPDCVERFLSRVQPKLLIIMETELWPNTLHRCGQKNIPVVLANARLSEKSAAGYQRFLALSRPMLQNISVVAAQHQSDADRFMRLGVDPQRICVTGSVKFDIKIDEPIKQKAAQLKLLWNQHASRTIWIAASTHEGEEEKICQVFKQLLERHPNALLLLVPRHPERFNKVLQLCQQMQLVTQRRSEIETPERETQVIIGDTMGELLLLYGCADIAFVGGSMVDHGGHNILEPAAWALPIITGESDYNFAEISRLLQSAGGLKKIKGVDDLLPYVDRLVEDINLSRENGEAALRVVESNRGAMEKLFGVIDRFL